MLSALQPSRSTIIAKGALLLGGLRYSRCSVESDVLFIHRFRKVKEETTQVPKPRGTPNPERPPLKKRATMRRTASKQHVYATKPAAETKVPRLPPKKQRTIRRHVLDRAETIPYGTDPPVVLVTPPWRKPPKKQSTVRRKYRRQATVPKASATKPQEAKNQPKASLGGGTKRQAQSSDEEDEVPFKTYKSEGKSTPQPSTKATTKRDPRLTHGKALQKKKTPSVPLSEEDPWTSPAERRGKVAVGIATKPPLTRIRSMGKTLNQVTLPDVAPPLVTPPGVTPPGVTPKGLAARGVTPRGVTPPGVTPPSTPPRLARKLSRKCSRAASAASASRGSGKAQYFAEPKVPQMRKAGSLRRQVLKRRLARQDTLEMDPAHAQEEPSASTALAR